MPPQRPDTGRELLAAQALHESAEIVGFGQLDAETRAFLLLPDCSAVDLDGDGRVRLRDVVRFFVALAATSRLPTSTWTGT